MSLLIQAKSQATKRLISIVLFSFLVTFVIARLIVYLVLDRLLPDFFLTIRGVHIHHFTYGVVILVFVSLYLILIRPESESKKYIWVSLIYGIGLGLTFDEFGMWVRLEDDYWIRQSYDAIIIVTLLLFNIIYWRSLEHFFRFVSEKIKTNLK
jgi:hypothetical protein